jgi:acyl-CoA thioester hydrolase
MQTMPFPTPFDRYRGEVLPAWIDNNNHMNLAYYVLLFDYATDAIYEAFGLDRDYRDKTNCGTFAAETHNQYVQELLVGEQVRVVSTIFAADAKRVHLGHEMLRLSDGKRAATQELLYLHVDLGIRRVVPWPPWLWTRLEAAAAAHAVLPRPDWVGRRIAMR